MIKRIKNKIYKLFHPVIGEIWCLHRVVLIRSLMPQNRALEITPDYLERLIIKYKKSGYEFSTLQDIYENKLHLFKFNFQNKFVNISFDDGFEDVYSVAYPILKKYNVPFTIYLTTDFPEKKAMIWWVFLEKMLLDNSEIILSTGEKYKCGNLKDKIKLFELLSNRIYKSNNNSTDEFKKLFVDYLENPIFDNEEISLSWTQIQEMYNDGLCTIGSHSVSHSILTKITAQDLRNELINSKETIEDKLNLQVDHFSYPHSFVNDKVEDEVKKIYKTAVLGYGGSIRLNDNFYRLSRNYIVEE